MNYQRTMEQKIPFNYLLMQWHKQIIQKQAELQNDFDKIISRMKNDLLPDILESVKVAGKRKTIEMVEAYEHWKKTIIELEPLITILIECHSDFEKLLAQYENYEKQLPALEDLKRLSMRDKSFLQKISVLLRNIVKAAEVIFIPDIRLEKKKDDAFEYFSREFIRQMRNLAEAVSTLRRQYSNVSDQMAIELEELIKQIKAHNAAEKETTKEKRKKK